MEKNLNTEDYYQTTDLNVVTILHYLNYKIESVDKTNPSKSVFWIEKKDGINEDIRKFWNKELMIEPQLFSSCMREVKNRLYNTIKY